MIEHFIRALDWISVNSIYIKSLVSIFIYSLFKLSYCLTRLEKYLFVSFAKIKSIWVCIPRTFLWNFKTFLQIQTLIIFWWLFLSNKFLHFPFKIRSLEFHSFMQTAKEITHTSQNQREIPFDLHLLLQDRSTSSSSSTSGPKGWTCPAGCPGGW